MNELIASAPTVPRNGQRRLIMHPYSRFCYRQLVAGVVIVGVILIVKA